MARFAVLLRAINVGGHNKVPMADLRRLIESLGCTDVATLLQSGNAVYAAPAAAGGKLGARLEAALAKELGVEVDCIVRTSAEWSAAIAGNPFKKEAEANPARLLVYFLTDAPGTKAVTALRVAIKGRETIAAAGKQLYAIYPDGAGTSKLTLPVIERALGVRATGRNWNTVLKVAELLGA